MGYEASLLGRQEFGHIIRGGNIINKVILRHADLALPKGSLAK
jgi:hypothetical protein